MPENAPVVLVPGSLPEGFCFTTWQALLNSFFTLSSGYLPGRYSFFNFGNTEPLPEDRDKPWLRLNGDGSMDQWYTYFSGQWLAPYPSPPSGSERRLWVGLEADLVTYDGGEAGAITDTTGSFWVVDHDFDARVPIGPGTFPVDPADPTSGATISVGDTGGKENSLVTLLGANIPSHVHDVSSEKSDETGTSETGRFQVSDGSLIWRTANTSDKIGHTRATGGDVDGATTPLTFTNLTPYRGTFVIMRSSRIYRRAIP